MKKHMKKWIWPAVMAVLLVMTARMVLAEQSPAQLLAALRQADLRYLPLGFGLMGVFVACEALCTRRVLATLGSRTSFRRCLGYSCTGFYFSTVTPSATGGQPMQVCAMSRDGVPAAHGALDMLLITICYQLATVIWAVAAMLFFPGPLGGLNLGLTGLLIFGLTVTLVLTAVMVLFLVCPAWTAALAGGLITLAARLRLVRDPDGARRKLDRQMEQYAAGGRLLRACPTLLPRLLFLSLVQLTALYLVPWTVYRALGRSPNGPQGLAAHPAQITGARSQRPHPPGPGSSAARFHQSFALFFGGLVNPAVVLSRGISCYGMLLVTGVITLILHLRRTASGRFQVYRSQVTRPYFRWSGVRAA